MCVGDEWMLQMICWDCQQDDAGKHQGCDPGLQPSPPPNISNSLDGDFGSKKRKPMNVKDSSLG